MFSSTAAVYGEPEVVPIREDAQLHPTNVYGRTKLMIEEMLSDYSSIYGSTYVALRYFNAAGADPSGTIGEDHHPETHLIPTCARCSSCKGRSTLLFLVLIIIQLMVHVCATIFMLMIWQLLTFWLWIIYVKAASPKYLILVAEMASP